jgi:hypothetical protein
MSGWSFPEGLFTLRATHHSISQPSTTSGELASPSWRLLGHVSHRARWLAPLMSKGSEGACTPSGIATFLLAAFTAQDRVHPSRTVHPAPQGTDSTGPRDGEPAQLERRLGKWQGQRETDANAARTGASANERLVQRMDSEHCRAERGRGKWTNEPVIGHRRCTTRPS